MKTKANPLRPFRPFFVTVALAAMGLCLQSMAPAAAIGEEGASLKPGKSIHMAWPHDLDCYASVRVTYVMEEDVDCNDMPWICVYYEACETFNIGTSSVFIPGPGTIMSVELVCGDDCYAPGVTVYQCNGARARFECCGHTYRISGSEDPVTGDINLSIS